MSPMIESRDLVRTFGEFTAVDHLTFSVEPGEFFGLLGPNGAGKTSTIRMIICALPITAGELYVDGMDARTHDREIKMRLGVVPQEDNLDRDLTVRKNLEVYARYFDIPKRVATDRITEGLELMQLEERSTAPIRALSGGMKRRLVIARALVNEPRLLILDEPTTGLDPQARHLVWRKLRLLRERGVTILLTTHYMDEAEHLCDRLVIMDNGRRLEDGPPRALIERTVGDMALEMHLTAAEEPRVRAYLDRSLPPRGRVEQIEDVLYAYGVGAEQARGVEAIVDDPYRVLYRRANLEDVFLSLTGRGLVE